MKLFLIIIATLGPYAAWAAYLLWWQQNQRNALAFLRRKDARG